MKRTAIRSIGDLLGDFVQESHLEGGLLQVRVYEAWDSLVIGRVELRDHTSRRTFNDGVLTCRMRSSVVRAHLQPHADALRDSLNRTLGGEYVKQVKLI